MGLRTMPRGSSPGSICPWISQSYDRSMAGSGWRCAATGSRCCNIRFTSTTRPATNRRILYGRRRKPPYQVTAKFARSPLPIVGSRRGKSMWGENGGPSKIPHATRLSLNRQEGLSPQNSKNSGGNSVSQRRFPANHSVPSRDTIRNFSISRLFPTNHNANDTFLMRVPGFPSESFDSFGTPLAPTNHAVRRQSTSPSPRACV